MNSLPLPGGGRVGTQTSRRSWMIHRAVRRRPTRRITSCEMFLAGLYGGRVAPRRLGAIWVASSLGEAWRRPAKELLSAEAIHPWMLPPPTLDGLQGCWRAVWWLQAFAPRLVLEEAFSGNEARLRRPRPCRFLPVVDGQHAWPNGTKARTWVCPAGPACHARMTLTRG